MRSVELLMFMHREYRSVKVLQDSDNDSPTDQDDINSSVPLDQVKIFAALLYILGPMPPFGRRT